MQSLAVDRSPHQQDQRETHPEPTRQLREGHKSKLAMSTKTYLDMVIEAIPAVRDRKGASRQAIATWIQNNCSKEAGAMFNARLRTALNKGIETGMLKEGNTAQRFRIGVLPKPTKPKKKVASKKKVTSKKKKASKKKKKTPKKKTSSKKKSAPKKKKSASKKKKKPASKKKSSSKKRRSRK